MIKLNGLKLTKQRKLVIDAIENLSVNATIKNILGACDGVNSSTVYRIIDLFLEKGIIEKRINENLEIYYVFSEEHGDYFTCLKCGKREKLDCPLINLTDEYTLKKGYQILNHTVILNGVCRECCK